MRRGEVWQARLGPAEGSEQDGIRPVVIVSRDAINTRLSIVVGIPCTRFRQGRRSFASHVLLRAPNGGLTADSVALCEQVGVLSKSRLLYRRGVLRVSDLARLEQAILITLDLPGQI